MTVKLYLHDGTIFEEMIENFNLEDFIESINTEQHKMLKFGKVGIMKNTIKMVDTQ